MSLIPILAPASYVTQSAIAFTQSDGNAQTVGLEHPLPITAIPFVASAALVGSTAANLVTAPFVAQPGRAVILALSGVWTGQVKVLRSTDGGVTKLPLTAGGQPFGIFTASGCEAVWEESEANAALYLDISVSAGTVTYRMGQ
jgi:hypothetical protein